MMRARSVVQFVKKRIGRHISDRILNAAQIAILGICTNSWVSVMNRISLQGCLWPRPPWHSESRTLDIPLPHMPGRNSVGAYHVLMAATPHNPEDVSYLANLAPNYNPLLDVLGFHPHARERQETRAVSRTAAGVVVGNRYFHVWRIPS